MPWNEHKLRSDKSADAQWTCVQMHKGMAAWLRTPGLY